VAERRGLVLFGELLLCAADASSAFLATVGRHAIDAGRGEPPRLTAMMAESIAKRETAKAIVAYGPLQDVQLVVDEGERT